jgi:hypothetical protein
VIDVTCTSCDIIYHADESHIGREFRCKVCGKIIMVARQELGPVAPRKIERPAEPVRGWKEQRLDRRKAIGIIAAGAVFLAVWLCVVKLWVRTPPAPSTTERSQSVPPEPVPQKPVTDLKPKLSPTVKEVLSLKLDKVPPEIKPIAPEKPLPEVHYYIPGQLPQLTFPPAGPSLPPPLIVTPKCAEGQTPVRLRTGERIEPDEETSGDSTLKVMNGLNVDAVVRLIDASTDTTSRFVYVRANEDYMIEGIKPGTYDLLYETGSDWISNCGEFQREEEIDEFEESHTFQQRVFEEGGYEHHTWTEARVSLNPVFRGTARTRKIDRKRFFQGDRRFSLQP